MTALLPFGKSRRGRNPLPGFGPVSYTHLDVYKRQFLNTLLSTLVLSLALAGAAIAGETVNINSADAATLDRVLVNIGPSKAQAIVEYRKAHGAFRSAEQLAEVKGVGLKRCV